MMTTDTARRLPIGTIISRLAGRWPRVLRRCHSRRARLLASDIKHADARTRVRPLRAQLPLAAKPFGEMTIASPARVPRLPSERQRLHRPLDLRYRRQAFHLNVILEERLDLGTIAAPFHRQHVSRYSDASPKAAIELVPRASARTASW